MNSLPEEGDPEEARQLVERNPLVLPTYRLERVHCATLNVDYSSPYGSGYARPLSPHRLKELRQDWYPLAVSPLTISRRKDNTLWIIDGNHRRVVAYERGMLQLPAMVHSGLSREEEARLYTLLGTVLGQTPWTRFQAKLVSLDDPAREIVRIAEANDLEINGAVGSRNSSIQAIARVEWIYGRGGPDALDWVFKFLMDAFGGERDSLGELQLEGVFGFYLRYADRVDRREVARLLGSSGVDAWFDRASSINQRADYGNRANTFGVAIADLVNDRWRKQGKTVKQLLPAWERSLGQFGSRYRSVPFGMMPHSPWVKTDQPDLAPQQLGANAAAAD